MELGMVRQDSYQALHVRGSADTAAEDSQSDRGVPVSPSSAGRISGTEPEVKLTLWEWILAQVDQPHFRTMVGSVTIMNLLCNGAEIEGKWRYWPVVEGLFVSFYIAEMLLKYARFGISLQPEDHRQKRQEEDSIWLSMLPSTEAILNFFDFLLIVAGVLELIFLYLGLTESVLYFKFFRLLRAVRIFRQFDVLIRFVECLCALAPNLTWIFGVILLIGYVFAAAITIYVHASEEEDLVDARMYFPTVGAAMFSLFQVTTMDGWAEIATPLIRYNPIWIVFFVSFIAFSSWTMISLLTAVVSDNMIAATQMRKEDEKAMEEQQRLKFISFLRESFAEADDDGNGMLDENEFNNMIENDTVIQKMEALGVSLPKEDLKRTFTMLDVDGSGELSIEEFITGLTQLQQSLNTAHVVSLDYALKRVQFTLLERMAVLQAMLSTNSQNLETVSKSIGKLIDSIEGLRSDFKTSGLQARPPLRRSISGQFTRGFMGKEKDKSDKGNRKSERNDSK
eukprot:TRINITY_DN13623_c0_g2_i1.p1 TRINITY_DN13623_c0_g2~~TRINITY_DN13623_c0_g2_i1.p1  ORF type:complete len:509 (+),score=103.75 TRINITY_DN13623_c0_g2_i1:110-1636(+)